MQPDLTQNLTTTPNRLKILIHQFVYLASGSVSLVCILAVQFVQEINAMENLFIRLSGIYAFFSQLLFFMACETALKGPFDKVAACGQKLLDGLTSILFYSVFGYFASKLREIYYSESVRLARSNSRTDTMFALCKIVLEWCKAIAVAVCLREQGMRYQQNTTYAFLTLSYYICTEKLFLDTVPNIIATLNLNAFDNLEHLYVPITMNLYALILGAIFNVYLSTTIYALFAIASSYFLIYLRLKDLYCNYIKKLNMEKRTFASFRQATERDLREWNDICAVCLNPMNRAKVTPCKHLFHAHCLKQCLQISFKCPLCKQSFVTQ